MKAKPAADPNCRPSAFCFDIAAGKFAHRQHVGSRLLVKHRPIVAERHLGIDHRFERFVGDLDPVTRVLRYVSVLGQNGGDRFADIANFPARQRVERGRLIILKP